MATETNPRSEQEVTTKGNRAADLAGIQPVSSRRVSEQVADQIRGLIVRERLAEGDRLPPERDLAERFGMTVPSWRILDCGQGTQIQSTSNFPTIVVVTLSFGSNLWKGE